MRRNVSLSLTQLGTAALLGALLLVPARAQAQDDVTLSMARERFKEGVAFFDKKDFAKARVAFLQAYALKKHPAVLLNLAQSELRSGHEADAAKHFSQYLREHKEATDAERQGAETGLTASKALVGELALVVDASGAEVYVDGNLEGSSPLPDSIYLPPGTHQIQAKKEGKSVTGEVAATAGQSTSLTLKLSGAPKPVAVPSGTASTEPLSEPPPPEEPPPSSRRGFISWMTSTPGAMIGVGLTGVGLIGGGAFAFGAKSSYDAANSVQAQIIDKAVNFDGKSSSRGVCNEPEKWLAASPIWANATEAARQDRARQYSDNCEKYSDNVKSGDTFKTLAIVSFAVAGAAAVGTGIYYLVDSKEPAETAKRARQRRVVVLPVYQPGFAGGLVSGSF
jgi:hypothetical protein